MAEKKRRLFSGKEYLNDFHQNIKGEYYYTGKMYGFNGSREEYNRYISYILTYAVLALLFTMASEFFSSVEMSRYPLTAFFWMFQLIACCVLFYASVRTAIWKNPLRAYVYRKTAETLKIKACISAVLSLAAALEMLIFLLIKGIDGELWKNLIRPLLSLSSAYTAFRLYTYLKTVEWVEIRNDGDVKVAPADMPKL